mgnify:CR=1 FL=1
MFVISLLQEQCLSRIVHRFFNYFISGGCNEDTHEWTDKIEKAVREIGQRGHAQNSSLCHSACVPGDENRSYGDGIFRCAAQQAAFIPFLFIDVAEHVSGEDNADVLVCRGKVQEQSGTYGGCYHAGCILHEADE